MAKMITKKCKHEWVEALYPLDFAVGWCKYCGTLRIKDMFLNNTQYLYPESRRMMTVIK